MEAITSGYQRKCKDSVAGVKNVWLLKWEKYNRSQIVTDGVYLIGFPSTFIFRFESLVPPTASEKMLETEGGKHYEQMLSLTIKADTSYEFDQLIKNDYRVLFLDNNGLYRIFGLYNGLECTTVDYKTGGSKSEFNGYSFTMSGKEEKAGFFIEDPASLGLTEEDFYLLFQNGDNIITQGGDKLIYR